MSGVQITGKIKPLNGGNFPVFEDTDGEGGLRTVADIAARNLISSASPLFCKEGMLCYVKSTQCVYQLNPGLNTWTFYDASPALVSQTTWFVDPAGSNDNDGLTPGTAIADLKEFSNRLCPRGAQAVLTNDITVNVNSVSLTPVSYGEMSLNVTTIEQPVTATFTVSIICAITSSAAITLTGVVQPAAATSVRGEFTTTVGTFVNQERIRMTTGAAAGAQCYSTGLHTGVLNTYVSGLCKPTFAGLSGALAAAVGDQCVVDTLTVSVNRVAIVCGGFTRVVIQDMKITRAYVGGSSTNQLFTEATGPVLFSGCHAVSTGGIWSCMSGGAILASCRVPPTGNTAWVGCSWTFVNQVVQGLMGVSGQADSYGITLDNGKLIVGTSGDFNHPGATEPTKLACNSNRFQNIGGIEAENGSAGKVAITVTDGSSLRVDDSTTYLWGASAAYGAGFAVMGNGYVCQNNVTTGTFAAIYKIPSTVNWQIGGAGINIGTPFAYSDNPIVLPNANCGLISISPNGSQQNVSDGGFYFTNQSGNQGPTAFLGMTGTGMYMVYGYVATTTLDATAVGNVTLNVVYTDDAGITQTKAVAIDTALTALGGFGGSVVIESQAAAISWSITGVVTPANSKYSVRCRITRVSNGA